jgi:outer membrane receptor for ferrienterochelin and colicin
MTRWCVKSCSCLALALFIAGCSAGAATSKSADSGELVGDHRSRHPEVRLPQPGGYPESIRSFYITDDRTYSYIGVRGFGRPSSYNSRILIIVDGHRLNAPIYGGVYVANEELLDVDLIDRVEIVRGPSSSLYGTGAFFAIINIITRDAMGKSPSELAVATGGYESAKGRATYGHVYKNGASVLVSATEFARQGQQGAALKAVDRKPVLTVSEIKEFARQGGIVEFVLVEDTVRFKVNLDAARNHQLKLSSQMLGVAVEVVRN